MHSISAAPRTALRCFASLLHKPSASCGQRPGHALSCSATSGACTLCLRLRVCLPQGSASPSGSASLCRWSCFASLGTLRFPRRLREPPVASPFATLGALPPRSDSRLARRRSPRAFFCYSRKIVNPPSHMSFPRKRESRGSVLTPFILPAKSMNPAPPVIPVPACAGTGSGGNPGAPYCSHLSFPRKRESRRFELFPCPSLEVGNPEIIRPKEVYRNYWIAMAVASGKVSRRRTARSSGFQSYIHVEISPLRPSGAPSK